MNTNTGFRGDNTSQSQRENLLNSIQSDNTSSCSHLRDLIRRAYYTFRQMCSCIRPQEQMTDHQMDAKDNRSAKRRKLSNGYELTKVDIDYENPISFSSGVKAIESQPMPGPVVPESDSDVKLTLPSKEISAKFIQQNKRNKNKNSNKRGKNGNKSYESGDPIVIPDLRPYNVVKGVCGLRNLGNTCYMNSGLQCLVNIALFNEFMTQDLKIFLVGFKQTSQQKSLTELMAELMEEMLSSKSQSVSPINFRRKVAKTFDIFSNNEQNDCFQFVVTILDQFHNELLEMNQYGYQSHENAIEYNNFDDYLKFNNTFISRNFHGFLRLNVECDCGQTIATNYPPFSIISLPQIDCNDVVVREVSLIRHNSQRVEKMRLRFTKREILISQLIKTLTKTYYEITKNSLIDNQLIVCKFWSGGDIYVYEIDPSFTRHYFVSFRDNRGITFGTPLLLNVNDSQYSTIESTFVALIVNNLPNIQSNPDLTNLQFLYCDGEYLIENWSQELPNTMASFLATDMDNELIQLCLNFYQVVNTNQSSSPQSSYRIPTVVTLYDCINQYLSYQKSDDKCADCRTRKLTGGQTVDTFSSLSYAILHAPNVLLLQLKSNPRQRYNCQFPLVLDLKSYVTNGRSYDGQYVYDLVAVSNYSGSSNSGHYTAYAKSCLNNNWYEINDSFVDQMDVRRLQMSTKMQSIIGYSVSLLTSPPVEPPMDELSEQLAVRERVIGRSVDRKELDASDEELEALVVSIGTSLAASLVDNHTVLLQLCADAVGGAVNGLFPCRQLSNPFGRGGRFVFG
ncbi:unnamed protein product [Medioppia subpectinata]|uniref:ubiquitinyl hydrolase 1 n=1 Tax=Medioppia subpectinata TaxID=1979941 RepID=A0A7R9KFQ3_9ACAR|nr:unnamed protein product [Medioppia subpectinata]CAG2102712.1 unnamed protein product [Medioppia subpectinata]